MDVGARLANTPLPAGLASSLFWHCLMEGGERDAGYRRIHPTRLINLWTTLKGNGGAFPEARTSP